LDFSIIALSEVVDLVSGLPTLRDPARRVAITFDDGPDWDYFDFIHPDVPGGCLKSFYRCLVEHQERGGQVPQGGYAAISFVIADRDARETLDRVTMAGRGHWRASWWHAAAAGGLLGIGNHSWDHVHASLSRVRQHEQRSGTFFGIDNEGDADVQIPLAQRFIWMNTAGLCVPFFAYPYGEAPPYLIDEYFPRFGGRHRLRAAFGTQGKYATRHSNAWHIPRFVFGQHWQSREELKSILEQSLA